ncbi:hypothetical protein POM88_013426 [Heracleum sosnowskyi]|uniref:Putative plant transposon protein domain-containing protein n=1 Tax=Heracleum sosnowskyi TaxID=360622 RepID=A0AAD8IYJ1_9APIA|nr:hypothetical protein POM88_013426 [Heracleum sosnowskyi]
MAPPKRGRYAGSSSTRRTSSSDDSSAGFGGDKFSSPEASVEYARLLSKAVAKERGFIPTHRDGNLVAMITTKGWEGICEAPEPVPLGIVREFYANAKAEKNGYSVVRGFTVDYTPAAISRVLRLPRMTQGEEDWALKTRADVDLENIVGVLCVPGTTWKYKSGTTEPVTFPASAMNRYAKAWNLFVCANIMPSSHAHDVTVERAIVLWGILNGKYVDLGVLLNRSIVRFLRGATTAVIHHAAVVTKLCTAVGVRWSEEEQLPLPSAPIDHAAIQRLEDWDGGSTDPSGLGFGNVDNDGMDARTREAARAGLQGASGIQQEADRAGFGGVQYRRLTRRIDAMHDINRHFATDLTQALGTAFRATGVDVVWPDFGVGSVYPPPDTPPETPPVDGGDDSDS